MVSFCKEGRHIRLVLKAAADFVLPRVCVVCGCRLLLKEDIICLHCLADLPMTRFWELQHNPMSDRFNAVIQVGLEEAWSRLEWQIGALQLGEEPEKYAYACALFLYSHEAPYRHILYNLKYEGRLDVGRYFGRMLGAKLASTSEFQDVDCVIPVPLHWLRLWRRGYNQAEVIAREVATALEAQLDCKTLRRKRRTRSQTKLDIKGKASNVSGAFHAKAPARDQHSRGTSIPSTPIYTTPANDKHTYDTLSGDTLSGDTLPGDTLPGDTPGHILLIDDTFTTGSTLHACYVALREVFPPSVRISVATLAFVGGT